MYETGHLYLSSMKFQDSSLSTVKPDPPVDVRVSPLTTKNLLVEWSPPPTWTSTDIFPLKYQLLYQWEIRGRPKFINVRGMGTHHHHHMLGKRQQHADTYLLWKLKLPQGKPHELLKFPSFPKSTDLLSFVIFSTYAKPVVETITQPS